jgi:hypothetical protein
VALFVGAQIFDGELVAFERDGSSPLTLHELAEAGNVCLLN